MIRKKFKNALAGQPIVKTLIEKPIKVLNQDEVDDLLRRLSGGKIEGYDKRKAQRAKEMKEKEDERLRILEKFRGRMLRLEIINDRLSRFATKSLSDLMRLRVDFNPISIDITLFGEFMRCLPVPTWLTVMKDKTNNIPLISIIDSRLVFAIVEHAMGGRGGGPKIEGREFTLIESLIVQEFSTTLTTCINKAYSEFIGDIDIKQERVEINPQFAGIIPHNAPCCVITFEVEMGVSLGAMTIVLSMDHLLPFLPFLHDRNMSLKIHSISDDDYFKLCERRKQDELKDAAKFLDIVPDKKYFKNLVNFNEQTFGQVFGNEHPQTIACIFSFLPPEISAKFILIFPYGARGEIIKRMREIYIAQPYFLEIIDKMLSTATPCASLWTEDAGELLLKALGEFSPESEKEIRNELKDI